MTTGRINQVAFTSPLASGPIKPEARIADRDLPPIRARRLGRVTRPRPAVQVVSNRIAFRRVASEETLVCVLRDHILPSERTVLESWFFNT